MESGMQVYGLHLAHLGETGNQLLSEHLSEVEVTTETTAVPGERHVFRSSLRPFFEQSST